MCIRIYKSCFKQKKHTHRNKKQKKLKKIEKQKKPKEEKDEENVAAVNKICGKSNRIQLYRLTICCVLLTYLIRQQQESTC